MENVDMTVSVVVSAFSMARYPQIDMLIRSLVDQTDPDFDVTFVVDENRELARAIEDLCKTNGLPNHSIIFNETNLGLSNSRNIGIDNTAGEIIAFIDDDATADPDWIATIKESFKDEKVGGLAGDIVPQWESEQMEWFPKELYWMISCSYTITPTVKTEIDRGFGVDMAFSRKAIDLTGRFDLRFGIKKGRWIGGEDTELFLRIKKAGYKIVFEPRMRVHHYIAMNRLSLKNLVKRAVAQGEGSSMIRKLSPDAIKGESGPEYLKDLGFRFLPEKLIGAIKGRRNEFRSFVLVSMVVVLIGVGIVKGVVSKPV
jgi:GT2 family glycosyltransferase